MPKQDAPIVPAEALARMIVAERRLTMGPASIKAHIRQARKMAAASRTSLLAALREVLPQSTAPGPGDGMGASDDPVYPQTIR